MRVIKVCVIARSMPPSLPAHGQCPHAPEGQGVPSVKPEPFGNAPSVSKCVDLISQSVSQRDSPSEAVLRVAARSTCAHDRAGQHDVVNIGEGGACSAACWSCSLLLAFIKHL